VPRVVVVFFACCLTDVSKKISDDVQLCCRVMHYGSTVSGVVVGEGEGQLPKF